MIHSRYLTVAVAALGAALSLAGCTEQRNVTAQTPSPCDEPRRVGTLPADVIEASGVAFSPRLENVLWVHNDSDDDLFALDRTGGLLARVRLPGPRPRDWEDIAAGPCGSGSGSCLFLADIGDNGHARSAVSVLRIPEPALSDGNTASPDRFVFRYPGGARDAEALFLLAGRIHIVSKGRNGPIALYRAPTLLTADTMMLEHIRTFTEGLVRIPDQVTGADATPAGDWVAIRTYRYLDLYRVLDDTLATIPSARAALAALREPQGEGIALNAAGEIFLVSENERAGNAPLSYLRCPLH